MSAEKEVRTKRKRQSSHSKQSTSSKNGRRISKPISGNSIYMLRPRRTVAALRRARRLAAQVRKELANADLGSLDETMSRLRGRLWS